MPDFIKGTRIEILPHDFGDEPEGICGNCDSWKEDLNGNHHCLNHRSPNETLLTDFNDHCAKFFPDPQRWPDADHG